MENMRAKLCRLRQCEAELLHCKHDEKRNLMRKRSQLLFEVRERRKGKVQAHEVESKRSLNEKFFDRQQKTS